jgi:hypothetical protein
MFGGSHTVIASVLEVTSADALDGGRRQTGAPAICPRVTAAIAAGEHPADALRSAQLEYLERSRLVTIADCLGLMCLSTLRPSLPSARPRPRRTRFFTRRPPQAREWLRADSPVA